MKQKKVIDSSSYGLGQGTIPLAEEIAKVFSRIHYGFFSGKLFDLLESFGWDYLVKVKLRNLAVLLKK